MDEADFQEVFVDFSLPVTDASDLTFRLGRQHLMFGKQRLVSPFPWGNSMRTFDGISAELTIDDWKVTGFWTRPVPVRKFALNRNDPGTQFYGLHADGKSPIPKGGLEVFWLHLDKRRSVFNGTAGRERRHTVGARIWGPMGRSFDYDVEPAYQFGSVGTGDVSAYSVASQVGYNMKGVPLEPRYHTGLDYASGDNGLGGDVGTFNQLFPLGHAYLGFVDAVGRQNIIDFSGGVTLQPHRRLTVVATGHNFWQANEHDALYNAPGNVMRLGTADASRRVGSELDLTAKYRIDRHLVVTLGYSRFFTGDFIDDTGPDDDVNFVYIWLQYT